jgi:hypothetical protein
MRRVTLLAGLLVAVIVAAVVIALREQPPERSLEAFCSQVTDAIGLDESLASLDPARLSPQIDALEQAALTAPPDIVAPVDTVLDLTRAIEDAVRSSTDDPTTAIEQTLREREAEVPAIVEAGRTLERYVSDRCGFALDTSTPADAS